MKYLFFLLSFLPALIAQSGQAEFGRIIGTVTSKESSFGLENVQVYIPARNIGAVTRSDGSFVLKKLQPGYYKLKIRMLGFETVTLDSVLVRAGEVVVLRPQLVLKVYEVHEIQVTASRHEALQQSIPQLVSVVNRLKIRQRNSAQTPEILREEMGVFIQKTSNGGGSPIIRGLKANKILLLIDGIRMNNATYRGGNLQYLNTIDPGSIERMEVVHGPSSALYGSDALGGTINTITAEPGFSRSGKPAWSGRLETGFSSAEGNHRFTLQTAVHAKKWGLSLQSARYGYGNITRGGNGGDELMRRLSLTPESGRNLAKKQRPNAYDARYSQFKFTFQPHYKHKFTLFYQLARQGKVPRYDVFERQAYQAYFYEPQNRDLAYLKYENALHGPLADLMILTLSIHRQKEGRVKQKTSSVKMTVDRFSTTTRAWQLQFNKIFRKKHFILYGAEAYYDRLSANSYSRIIADGVGEITSRAPLYPDNSRHDSFGVYAQSEWHLTPPWMLTSGLRYSAFLLDAPFSKKPPLHLGLVKRRTFALTASVSSRYEFNEKISFVSNIAQGFRAPNLDDVSKFGPGKGDSFYDVPNPKIQSETGISLDGGLKFAYENARLNLVFYYTRLNDILIRRPAEFNALPYIIDENDTLAVFHKANAGKAVVSGFEIGGEALLKWGIIARANLSYAYGFNQTANEPLTAIPPLNGLFSLRRTSPHFWLELSSRFALEQNRLSSEDLLDLRIPVGGTPGWFTLNARSGWAINDNIDLQLALMNMLDWNYREHLSGLNAPGRSIVMSGKIELF